MSDAIVVINSGSTSVKFAGYQHDSGDGLSLVYRGQLQGIGSHPSFVAKGADGKPAGRPWMGARLSVGPGWRAEVHLRVADGA